MSNALLIFHSLKVCHPCATRCGIRIFAPRDNDADIEIDVDIDVDVDHNVYVDFEVNVDADEIWSICHPCATCCGIKYLHQEIMMMILILMLILMLMLSIMFMLILR